MDCIFIWKKKQTASVTISIKDCFMDCHLQIVTIISLDKSAYLTLGAILLVNKTYDFQVSITRKINGWLLMTLLEKSH